MKFRIHQPVICVEIKEDQLPLNTAVTGKLIYYYPESKELFSDHTPASPPNKMYAVLPDDRSLLGEDQTNLLMWEEEIFPIPLQRIL